MLASHTARPGRAVAVAVLALCAGGAWAQTATLPFSSYASVYGSLYAQYSSPLLGDVSFSLYGPSDYKSNYGGSGNLSTGVASMDYTIAAGQGGTDPVYDIVTSSGQYGFGYSGRAEVDGMTLHTKASATTVDSSGQSVAYAPNASISGTAYASWSQQFYIGATAARPAGSYGAILMGITLDGSFGPTGTPPQLGYGYAQLSVQSNFTDTGGASFQSTSTLSTSYYDTSWTGSKTQYQKLLFQFGTAFTVQMYQYASAGSNGETDFFNTGRVSSIEVPFQATLLSGAEQAGLGSTTALFGSVVQSATADAINTNWDFSNNGGGFVPPPVPEPSAGALLLAGLGLFGYLLRRRAG